jgi:nitrate/nitrite transporter NarK
MKVMMIYTLQKTTHRLKSQLLLITGSFVIQNSTHTIGANLSFKTIKTAKKSEKGSQAGKVSATQTSQVSLTMLLGTSLKSKMANFCQKKFIAWYCWKALDEWDFSETI